MAKNGQKRPLYRTKTNNMQHFYSIPSEIPETYWVLKSPIINGILTETLFYDELPLFKDSFTCESPFCISLCDFQGIQPKDAEKHYKECFEIERLSREERVNTPYVDEDENEDEEYEFEFEYDDIEEEVVNSLYRLVIFSGYALEDLKDKEWFSECRLVFDDKGVELFGKSAFFIPYNRFKEL